MTQEAMLGRTAVGGKRSSKIEARVHDETKFDLTRRCHELGISESEFVASLVEVSLYGADHVLRMQQQRLSGVCGLSALMPEQGRQQ